VTRIGELGTALAVTSNRRTLICQKLDSTSVSFNSLTYFCTLNVLPGQAYNRAVISTVV
jgi:hypothetical protein